MIFVHMSNPLPSLKLHAPVDESAFDRSVAENLPAFRELNAAFASATGWKLEYRELPVSRARRLNSSLNEIPIRGELEIVDMSHDWPAGKATASRMWCDKLVSAWNRVLEELDQNREHNWRLRAELASTVPVTLPADHQRELAKQLSGLLQEAREELEFEAALLYLLNDAHDRLSLQFQSGCPENSCDRERVLEHSYFELQALELDMVRIDNALDHLPHHFPRICGNGVCLPIRSERGNLGVLWLLDRKDQCTNPPTRQTLKLYARLFSTTLERASLSRELAARRRQPAAQSTAEYASQTLPREVQPALEPPSPIELDLDQVQLSKLSKGSCAALSMWRYEPTQGLTMACVATDTVLEEVGIAEDRFQTALESAFQCGTAYVNELQDHFDLFRRVIEQQFSQAMKLSGVVCRVDLLTGEYSYSVEGHGAVCILDRNHHKSSSVARHGATAEGGKSFGFLCRQSSLWIAAMTSPDTDPVSHLFTTMCERKEGLARTHRERVAGIQRNMRDGEHGKHNSIESLLASRK